MKSEIREAERGSLGIAVCVQVGRRRETLRDSGTGGKQAAREQNGPSPGGRSLIVMFRLLQRLKQPTWWRELGRSGDVSMMCPVLRSVMRYVGVRCLGGAGKPLRRGDQNSPMVAVFNRAPSSSWVGKGDAEVLL